jgi:hypothetical protein
MYERISENQNRAICEGIHKIVSKNLPGKGRSSQEYIGQFQKTLCEFVRSQKKCAKKI